MQLHNISRVHPNKKMASVGRGGRRGKTSGRGTKGQNARAGRKKRPEIRDFIKRLPKLRGYAFNTIQTKPITINFDLIERTFSKGEEVSPRTLVEKGVLGLVKGNPPRIKILSDGELTKNITVRGCAMSLTAKTKIEKAGGSVTL